MVRRPNEGRAKSLDADLTGLAVMKNLGGNNMCNCGHLLTEMMIRSQLSVITNIHKIRFDSRDLFYHYRNE